MLNEQKTLTMMKKMILSLIAMLAIAAQANAMSYEQARNEALFLTDKMAYELNLTDAQYEAAYEINLDYLMGVTSQADVFGSYWERRNADIQYILYRWQWDAFCAATYFYRPLYWNAGYWHFGIYARYPHRDYFYFGRPHFYVTYHGGHSWRMNGGRSYYAHHHDNYRPHHDRNHHTGMRDGWDRGDYRNNNGGRSIQNRGNRTTTTQSSTRTTVNNHAQDTRSTYTPSQSARNSYGSANRTSGASANRSASSSFTRSAGTSFNRSAGTSFTRSAGTSFHRSSSASASRSSVGASRNSIGASRSSSGSHRGNRAGGNRSSRR